jgi:hypothetical protein
MVLEGSTMYRFILVSVFCVTAFSTTGSCEAQCFRNGWSRFWNSVKTGYHENHQWPYQHNPAARRSLMNPLNMMVDKGWKQQNTLTQFHFEESSNQLNRAGQRKVYDILFNTPKSHRSIFVVPGEKKLVTDQRIRAIQLEATQYLPSGEQISVGVSRDLPYPPTSEVVGRIQDLSLEALEPPLIRSSSDQNNSSDKEKQAVVLEK